MNLSDRKQMRFDGRTLYRYETVVTRDAVPINSTPFVDWFINDDEATKGIAASLTAQGYNVAEVIIGNPCVVALGPALARKGVA